MCVACGQSIEAADTCIQCQESPYLEGRYTLHRIVGRGATGTTFRGRHTQTNQLVAIKEIPLRHTDEKLLEQLDREARVLRQLNHPCVPQYVEHFHTGIGRNRTFYLVQEFIDGLTLEDEQETRRYTETDILDVLHQLLYQ